MELEQIFWIFVDNNDAEVSSHVYGNYYYRFSYFGEYKICLKVIVFSSLPKFFFSLLPFLMKDGKG